MYRQPIKTVVTICRTYSSHHDIREVSVTFRTKALFALKIFMQSVKWGAYLCSTVLSSQKKTSLRLATFKGQKVFDMDSSWTEHISTPGLAQAWNLITRQESKSAKLICLQIQNNIYKNIGVW